MVLDDLHVHSCFCDGKDRPEDIVEKALELGMRRLGILTHSYTFFDESYCIRKDEVGLFIDTINALKETYSDRIQILCGVEQDYYSESSVKGFDYVIGSVHYMRCDEKYYPVDEDEESFQNMIDRAFHGDPMELAEAYYDLEKDIVVKTGADIIGHFDLITKFNGKGKYLNIEDPSYQRIWKRTVDHLLKYDVPFEINMGAMARGYRTEPYPDRHIISYIRENGGKLLLSSDAHSKDHLMYRFPEYEELLG